MGCANLDWLDFSAWLLVVNSTTDWRSCRFESWLKCFLIFWLQEPVWWSPSVIFHDRFSFDGFFWLSDYPHGDDELALRLEQEAAADAYTGSDTTGSSDDSEDEDEDQQDPKSPQEQEKNNNFDKDDFDDKDKRCFWGYGIRRSWADTFNCHWLVGEGHHRIHRGGTSHLWTGSSCEKISEAMNHYAKVRVHLKMLKKQKKKEENKRLRAEKRQAMKEEMAEMRAKLITVNFVLNGTSYSSYSCTLPLTSTVKDMRQGDCTCGQHQSQKGCEGVVHLQGIRQHKELVWFISQDAWRTWCCWWGQLHCQYCRTRWSKEDKQSSSQDATEGHDDFWNCLWKCYFCMEHHQLWLQQDFEWDVIGGCDQSAWLSQAQQVAQWNQNFTCGWVSSHLQDGWRCWEEVGGIAWNCSLSCGWEVGRDLWCWQWFRQGGIAGGSEQDHLHQGACQVQQCDGCWLVRSVVSASSVGFIIICHWKTQSCMTHHVKMIWPIMSKWYDLSCQIKVFLHFGDDVSHKNSDHAYLHLWSIFWQIFTTSVNCQLSNFREEITKNMKW